MIEFSGKDRHERNSPYNRIKNRRVIDLPIHIKTMLCPHSLGHMLNKMDMA